MTEDEAKTKWCPMVRLYNSASSADAFSWDNRGNAEHNPNCIGSDCMMWVDESSPQRNGPPGFNSHKLGRCGLAK